MLPTERQLPDALYRLGWADGPDRIAPQQGLVRAADRGGRFDDPSGLYGLLYCAESAETAIAEVLASVREAPAELLARIEAETVDIPRAPDDPQFPPDANRARQAELDQRRLVAVDGTADLSAIDMNGTGTREWLATVSDVSLTGEESSAVMSAEAMAGLGREATQRIGSRVIREFEPAALSYDSRRGPEFTCVALVGVPGQSPDGVQLTVNDQPMQVDDSRVRDALDQL